MVPVKGVRGRGGRVAQASRRAGGGRIEQPLRLHLRDQVEVGPDDSTEEDVPIEAVHDVGAEESRLGVEHDNAASIIAVPANCKRGRGPAKGTKFEQLRKLGKIPLGIKDSHRGPSCENVSVFTGRLSYIIKTHADMTHASWTVVPQKEKDELIDRVRADFVLDWTRLNHRETVTMALADKFNAFHYEMHKNYLKYATHEEALLGGTSAVEKPVWECLCQRWGSSAFKEVSRRNTNNRRKQKVKHTGGRKSFVRILEEKRETTRNLVEFYKEVHWSRKKDKFINATSEHNYNLMVEKLNEWEGNEDGGDDNEAAAMVFKEVLGPKSGYAQGLGHAVIPDPSPTMRKNKEFVRLEEENEKNKANAENIKAQLDAVMGDMAALRNEFSAFDKQLNTRITGLEFSWESQRETHA